MRDEEIFRLLNSLDDNKEKNLKKIKKFMRNYSCATSYLLYRMFSEHHNKDAIKKFVEAYLIDSYTINDTYSLGRNFIQLALNEKYDMSFIINLINITKERGLNINHQDEFGNTIIHQAFYSKYPLDEIIILYKVVLTIGFNSSLINNYGKSILDKINACEIKTKDDASIFKQIYTEGIMGKKDSIEKNKELVAPNIAKEIEHKEETKTINKGDIKFLEQYGTILNKKEFATEPIIGREEELENLIISLAQNKIVPVLVGESGIGKTAIVDELAYMVKMGKVPAFLKNKLIVETSAANLTESTRYRGDLEEKVKKLMEICISKNIILFIDEIHLICGAGTSDDSSIDISSIIRPYIDRQGIKVIGATTTDEYEKYFVSNSIKRRFDKIMVSEPEDIYLQQILEKKIKDYAFTYGISCDVFLEKYSNFTSLLAEYTSKKHRVYNDNINNPSLCISIIDKAFAYARVYDASEITLDHFIKSINSCNRIYDTSKQKIIEKLSYLTEKDNVKRLVKVDFSQK